MEIIKVKNWGSFQSYKDRKPPWIRLHKTLLDNFEFQSMSADARALLPMLWLLASEDENPKSGLIRLGIKKISFRLRIGYENVTGAIQEIVNAGFIEILSDIPEGYESVTDSLRICTKNVTSETETETETERKSPYPLYENQRQNQKDDFLKNDDVGKEGSLPANYKIENQLNEKGLRKAKINSPGWDIYYLMQTYDGLIHSGDFQPPDYPNSAFPAWCLKVTKGKRPV